MDPSQRQNRRKGIMGSILFHVLLVVAFIFMGLTYQDPPPAEEGISINFGLNNEGKGEINPKDNESLNELTEETEKNEENITQNTIETTNINKPRKKENPTEKVTQKEAEKEQEINQKAIYPGKKKNNSEGKNKSDGNQGITDGDPNSDKYEGGGEGEDGAAYQLGGRKAIEKPKPQGNQIEGKVVVIITVNRLGNVIYAKAGAKGSTTLNKELLERARKAALKTKFNANKDAIKNQQGKIIYDFRLN